MTPPLWSFFVAIFQIPPQEHQVTLQQLKWGSVISTFDIWLIWTPGPPEIPSTYLKFWKHGSKCLILSWDGFRSYKWQTSLAVLVFFALGCFWYTFFSACLKKWVWLKTICLSKQVLQWLDPRRCHQATSWFIYIYYIYNAVQPVDISIINPTSSPLWQP